MRLGHVILYSLKYFLLRYFPLPRVTWNFQTAHGWVLTLDPEGSRHNVCHCAKTPCTPFRCHVQPLHHLELMLGALVQVSDRQAQGLPSLPGLFLPFFLCKVLPTPYFSFLLLLILHAQSCGPTFPSYGVGCHSSQPTRGLADTAGLYFAWLQFNCPEPLPYIAKRFPNRYVALWFRQLFTYSPTSLVLWNTARGHIFLSWDSRE